MADVSVEFGAKDTGLESTLKTVQAEMTRLQTEIKSGELSFNELTSAMRDLAKADKVSQQLQSIGGAAAGASPQVDKLGKDGKEMGDNVKKGSDKGGMSLGELAKASGVAGAAFAAGMAVFNTAMKGVQAVAASFGSALDLGGQLSDLSAQTGVAAGELLVLQRAFDNTGAGAEKVSPAIAKMSSSIVDATSGTGAAAKAFDQLGLSAAELINLPAEQQFQKIGNALAGVANETQRSALASDVFGGKLGKDLLPLMTNFSGETRTATQQLGSMVDVMNENSDAFDSIGDGIKVAQGKLTEFAAGLMSVMAPAIEAVVTALTRINAAQIGKDLGLAFVGAGEAMKGFQSAVDAFEAGNISLALKSIFESVKLQAMETGNSIYKNLTAAFQTAGDFIGTIFAPSGALATTIVSAFEFIGNKAAAGMMRTLAAGFAGNVLTEGIALSLNTAANQANKTANEMEASLSGAATRITEQFAKAGAAMPENFAKHQEALSAGLFDTAEQAKKVAAVAEEINTAAGKHPDLIKNAAQETRNLIEAQAASAQAEEAKIKAAADIAVAKMKEVELQIQLNDAIATGNTAEQARLEKIIAAEKGAERIKTLTEEYAKSMPVDEAARLANEIFRSETNMLAAKNAATKTKEELGGVEKLLKDIAEKKVEDPIKKFREESKQAKTDLQGISKILNVDIAGGSQVDTMKNLGLDPYAITGSKDQLDAIKEAIDILKKADPADLTPKVDKVGVQDNIDAVQSYIQSKLGGTTTANIEATADKTAADNAAGAIKDKVGSVTSSVTTQTDDNNIASTRATIEQGVAGIPTTFSFDTQKLRDQIEAALQNLNISFSNSNAGGGDSGSGGGEGGEGGQGGIGGNSGSNTILTDIHDVIKSIRDFVETIEGKLPLSALI